MKVTMQTDDVLVVEDRPWGFGLIMIAGIVILAWASMDNYASGHRPPAIVSGGFAVVLTVMLPVFIKRVMLTLNRQTDVITLTTRSLRKQTTKTYPLSDLRHANFSTSKNSDGDEMHAVELIFQTGTVPVTDVATGGDEAPLAAAAINAWLQVDSPTASA